MVPETVAHAYRRLHTALEVALGDSLIRRNPADGVCLSANTTREAIALTEGEVAKLIEASVEPLRSLLLVAISAGMRRGECWACDDRR